MQIAFHVYFLHTAGSSRHVAGPKTGTVLLFWSQHFPVSPSLSLVNLTTQFVRQMMAEGSAWDFLIFSPLFKNIIRSPKKETHLDTVDKDVGDVKTVTGCLYL